MSQPGSTSNRKRIRAFLEPDEISFDETWARIKESTKDILEKHYLNSFEQNHRDIHILVLRKHGEKVYNGMKKIVSDHLSDVIAPRILEAMDQNQLPEMLNLAWSDYTTAMIMIRDISNYVDRVYVLQANLENVYSLGLRLFKELVIEKMDLSEELRKIILRMVSDGPDDINIICKGMKKACEIFVSLGLYSQNMYVELFEEAYLKEIAEIYNRQRLEVLLKSNDITSYIGEVEAFRENESQKAERYPDTKAKVLELFDQIFITDNMDTFINWENKGVEHLLANDMMEDLNRVYNLLRRVENGPTILAVPLVRYLRTLGGDRGFQTEHVNYIESFLALKDHFDHFLVDAFQCDKFLKGKINSVFGEFFNQNDKSPEYLALYLADFLTKNSQPAGKLGIDDHLDKAIQLFCFLEEKDIFETCYKRHLAKRLLLDKSISDDWEKALLSKMKGECGCQFTRNLESMFHDKELWTTHSAGFKDYKDAINSISREQDAVDISVRVLGAQSWPTPTSSAQCILPTVCMTSFKTFGEFYSEKYNGRKIVLNTLLGNAEISAVFHCSPGEGNGQLGSNTSPVVVRSEKILQTNTQTMVVLMRFNAKPILTFQEIMADTQIPEKELKRILQSLAMGKPAQRILCRKEKGKEIEETDEFYVNDSFISKSIRIKIQLIAIRNESEQERKEIKNRIDKDRKFEVEAAIVRIMKSQKQLMHNVTEQLCNRFIPSPNLIKTRIESLIEKEILARDNSHHDVYNYVA